MAYMAQIAGFRSNILSGSDAIRRLNELSSNKAKIGTTTKQLGADILAVSAAVATIPVVGWLITAGGALIGTFLELFGRDYATSTNVRWLTQNYENYVLGQNVSSDNHVNEADVPAAQKWFSYVLGVPIFDRLDWYKIKGWSPTSETSLNNSDADRVASYKTSPRAVDSTDAQIMQAVQIAKTMNFTDPHGSWASKLVAPTLVTNDVNAVQAAGTSPVPPAGVTDSNNMGLLLFVGLGILGYLWYRSEHKRKKNRK